MSLFISAAENRSPLLCCFNLLDAILIWSVGLLCEEGTGQADVFLVVFFYGDSSNEDTPAVMLWLKGVSTSYHLLSVSTKDMSMKTSVQQPVQSSTVIGMKSIGIAILHSTKSSLHTARSLNIKTSYRYSVLCPFWHVNQVYPSGAQIQRVTSLPLHVSPCESSFVEAQS